MQALFTRAVLIHTGVQIWMGCQGWAGKWAGRCWQSTHTRGNDEVSALALAYSEASLQGAKKNSCLNLLAKKPPKTPADQ